MKASLTTYSFVWQVQFALTRLESAEAASSRQQQQVPDCQAAYDQAKDLLQQLHVSLQMAKEQEAAAAALKQTLQDGLEKVKSGLASLKALLDSLAVHRDAWQSRMAEVESSLCKLAGSVALASLYRYYGHRPLGSSAHDVSAEIKLRWKVARLLDTEGLGNASTLMTSAGNVPSEVAQQALSAGCQQQGQMEQKIWEMLMQMDQPELLAQRQQIEASVNHSTNLQAAEEQKLLILLSSTGADFAEVPELMLQLHNQLDDCRVAAQRAGDAQQALAPTQPCADSYKVAAAQASALYQAADAFLFAVAWAPLKEEAVLAAISKATEQLPHMEKVADRTRLICEAASMAIYQLASRYLMRLSIISLQMSPWQTPHPLHQCLNKTTSVSKQR